MVQGPSATRLAHDQTHIPHDPEGDLVRRFREVGQLRAEWTAIEAPDGHFTYREVELLSNRLGHQLAAMGVERDRRVAICLPRGAGELISLLATLKAGGAYVPLDSAHPLERLLGIVEDAAPEVLITDHESPLYLQSGFSGPVIFIDDIRRTATELDATPLVGAYDPEDLAYILFTSGSTGRPKGVEITRGAFANFLGSMAHTPGLSPSERLLAITTTSFDIAGLELFLPLWVGATVLIADRETARDPRRLRKRLETDTVSVLQATPTTWRLLLEADWRPGPGMRMLCGGEALPPTLAQRLLEGGGELWNMYGPTETTVWSSLERVHPGFDRITVGRPIDRTTMYVLDDALAALPPEHEGELWIGGSGLARGYFRRPDLTAERFIPDPHGRPGQRIYRTGDLGRRLVDGRFECLGRIDHQVKIRGFRIELGEIETVLRAVPGVSEALVVADRSNDAEPRLVAYWIGQAEREALAAGAKRKLPQHMVPAAYVHLEAFPLNTNGKIDRKQLPIPTASALARSSFKALANDTETRIAAIWRNVLGLAEVGADQDFFALGGTSVLAARVINHLDEELGVEIPLQAFYELPTVEGIAARVGRRFSPDAPIVVRLRDGAASRPPLWCVFGVTIYQALARAFEGDQPVIGVHVPNRYRPGRERQPTIDEAARRYVDLIRRHQAHGPYHLVGLCFGGIVAHEIARQLEELGETVAIVTIIDSRLPRGEIIDQLGRARAYARHAVEQPGQLPGRIAKHLKRQAAGLASLRAVRRALDGVRTVAGVGPDGTEPMDLPFDGPEVEAAVARFAAAPRRLRGPLLVVRATREPTPDWAQIAPDHGWGAFAETVVVRDIPAFHLQVLEEPHVNALAQAMAEARGASDGAASPPQGAADGPLRDPHGVA
jgi:amino acid adenylation domain-containing protein